VKETPQWMLVGKTKFLARKVITLVPTENVNECEYIMPVSLVPVCCGDSVLLPSIEVKFINKIHDNQVRDVANDENKLGTAVPNHSSVICHLQDNQRRVSVVPALNFDHHQTEDCGTFELEKVFTFVSS